MACENFEAVLRLKKKLKKYSGEKEVDEAKLLKIFKQLQEQQMSYDILKKTFIGRTVNEARKKCNGSEASNLAKSLIISWKKLAQDSDDKQKKESPIIVEEEPGCSRISSLPMTDDPLRLKSRDLICQALHSTEFAIDFYELAAKIEACIYEELNSTDVKYTNRVKSRILNLRDAKNPKLKEHVLNGVISPEQISCMTSEEMASDELKELRIKLTKKAISEAHAPSVNRASSDLFKCSRCGERDTTYNQVQTLSGDEPMTTFVACNKCGRRWKFN